MTRAALHQPVTPLVTPIPPVSDQASRLRLLVETSLPLESGGDRRTTPAPARASFLLVIASGKGGVGKSNLAVNLAIAFAKRRLRTALIDADLGVANADVLCGMSPRRRLDPLADPASPLDLDDLALQAPGGFTLIPGTLGVGAAANLAAPQRARLLDALTRLEARRDVLIVDASPGVGPMVTSLLTAADLGLIVTTPEPTAITDAYALVKCVRAAESPGSPPSKLRLIVNNAADRAQAEAATARIQAATEHFLRRQLPTLGWIAHDPHLPAAVFARQPVLLRSPRAPASRAIDRLAGAILAQWLPNDSEAQPVVVTTTVPQPVVAPRASSWPWRWLGLARRDAR